MSRADELDLRYLKALTTINRSLAHAMRAHIGAAKIQIDLVSEILKRSPPLDQEGLASIQSRIGVSQRAFNDVVESTDCLLAATRPAGTGEADQDLRKVVKCVADLLEPFFKDKNAALRTSLPSAPLPLDGSRDVILRALLVTLLQVGLTVTKGQTVELRLDADGVLEVEGPPAHQWLPAVADIIEHIGGGIDAGPQGSIVAIRLPIQTRAR